MTTQGTSPRSSRDDAVAIVRTLRDAGHIAYFAGGCVRDQLLGLTPKDFDVATDATPEKVRQLFRNTQAVGAAFGVILVRVNGASYEVATFRTDGSYTDGRRPDSVRFATAEEDARRRDFTVNGLFLDPLSGQVLDFVGGQDDVARKVLRAIGDPDTRFGEDYLRMLRAARFAARFAMSIEPTTARAIRNNAPKLIQISPERIADELRRLLVAPSRLAGWTLLWDLQLIGPLYRMLPETSSGLRRQSPDFFSLSCAGDRVGQALALASAGIAVRLACGLDIRRVLEPVEVRRLVGSYRKTLRLSNDETDDIGWALAIAHLIQHAQPGVAMLKRFLAQPLSRDARVVLTTTASIDPQLAARIDWLETQLQTLEREEFAPPPLLTGDDLIAAGLTPGPRFKVVLEEVYDAQLEGRIASREDALNLALRR